MKHALVSQEEVSARVASYLIRCVMAIVLVALIISTSGMQQ